MNKYQSLITKIHLKTIDPDSDCNFSQSELKLITDALETIQFLEIIFKAKKEKN